MIAGLGGDDTINAGGGRDFICPGGGADTVHGGAGLDNIEASDGNDDAHRRRRSRLRQLLRLAGRREGQPRRRTGDRLGFRHAEQLRGRRRLAVRGQADRRRRRTTSSKDGAEATPSSAAAATTSCSRARGRTPSRADPATTTRSTGTPTTGSTRISEPGALPVRGSTVTRRSRGSAAPTSRDVLIGNGGQNGLYGYLGNDRLLGKGGNDWIYGGPGKRPPRRRLRERLPARREGQGHLRERRAEAQLSLAGACHDGAVTPSPFTLEATDGAARAGVLRTAHGDVATPAFMPVGTKATVKGLHPDRAARPGRVHRARERLPPRLPARASS